MPRLAYPPSTMTHDFILGTAGHIDHGKTALVRCLTGCDTDRLPEEKKRGITIDIGFAELQIEDLHVGVIDVPGHEKFIRNMLAGASGIDVALLVVAADDSVMPQTREHLEILQLLQVKHGVIAITKCDKATEDWTQLVEDEVSELVRGTFLEKAKMVRTSAHTNSGIDELRAAIAKVASTVHLPTADSPFRLAVDRSFVKEGLGTIITGTVWSGSVQVGDEVDLMPSQQTVRVRGLHSHDAAHVVVRVGQRAAIQLAGVHHSEIDRGNELAASHYLHPTKVLTVSLSASTDCPRPIKHRSTIRLHLGTAEVIADVSLLRGTTLEAGDTVEAQLFCHEPVIAIFGQPFVIRSESPVTTLGGGHILQPTAIAIARKRTDLIDRLQYLENDHSNEIRVATAIHFYEVCPWGLHDLIRDTGLSEGELLAVLDTLQQADTILTLGTDEGRVVRLHASVVVDFQARLLGRLKSFHEQNPAEIGTTQSRMYSQFSYLNANVFNQLMEHLIEKKVITQIGLLIAHPKFGPQLSKSQRKAKLDVIDLLLQHEMMPPTAPQLANEVGVTESDLRPLMRLAVAANEVVHIGGAFFLHVDVHRELIVRMGDHFNTTDQCTVGDIREILNTSRKYAVPLCEYMDRIGFTKRQGDIRVVGPQHASVRAAYDDTTTDSLSPTGISTK